MRFDFFFLLHVFLVSEEKLNFFLFFNYHCIVTVVWKKVEIMRRPEACTLNMLCSGVCFKSVFSAEKTVSGTGEVWEAEGGGERGR